jgi:hypothetical protein
LKSRVVSAVPKRDFIGCFSFPAVETAGYCQTSRWRDWNMAEDARCPAREMNGEQLQVDSRKHSGLAELETRQCRVSTSGLFTVGYDLFTTEGMEDTEKNQGLPR